MAKGFRFSGNERSRTRPTAQSFYSDAKSMRSEFAKNGGKKQTNKNVRIDDNNIIVSSAFGSGGAVSGVFSVRAA